MLLKKNQSERSEIFHGREKKKGSTSESAAPRRTVVCLEDGRAAGRENIGCLRVLNLWIYGAPRGVGAWRGIHWGAGGKGDSKLRIRKNAIPSVAFKREASRKRGNTTKPAKERATGAARLPQVAEGSARKYKRNGGVSGNPKEKAAINDHHARCCSVSAGTERTKSAASGGTPYDYPQ